MTRRSRAGFTLIEVIIAMAIAAVLVVAVQSATLAMTKTARKQAETGVEEARFQRFAEIFRMDLQGWYFTKTTPTPAPTSPISPVLASNPDKVLLRFSTATDSLAATSSNRSVSLQYVLRLKGAEFQLIRTEIGAAQPSEIVVWHGNVEPKLSFFQPNQGWTSEWTLNEAPACVQFEIGSLGFTIAPY